MKNKLLSTVVISLLMITNTIAQEQKPVKIHELGLTFSNFDNFGIRYKTGNEKTLLRITLLAMNINFNNTYGKEQDSTTLKNSGYGAGFRIGFEKPIAVVKNFNLFYGLDLVGYFDFLKSKNEYPNSNLEKTTRSVSSGIAFVFGGSYLPGEHFRISAEISPSLLYTYRNDKTNNNGTEKTLQSNNVGFGLSNYGASITVAYRFNK